MAFSDGAHRLWIVGTDAGKPKQVAQDKLSEIHDQAFSPDGRWLAFSLSAVGRRRDLVLYEIATDKLSRLGDGSGIDSNPAWSSDGKYLYFASSRHENPVGSDIEFDFAILKSGEFTRSRWRGTPPRRSRRHQMKEADRPRKVNRPLGMRRSPGKNLSPTRTRLAKRPMRSRRPNPWVRSSPFESTLRV